MSANFLVRDESLVSFHLIIILEIASNYMNCRYETRRFREVFRIERGSKLRNCAFPRWKGKSGRIRAPWNLRLCEMHGDFERRLFTSNIPKGDKGKNGDWGAFYGDLMAGVATPKEASKGRRSDDERVQKGAGIIFPDRVWYWIARGIMREKGASFIRERLMKFAKPCNDWWKNTNRMTVWFVIKFIDLLDKWHIYQQFPLIPISDISR